MTIRCLVSEVRVETELAYHCFRFRIGVKCMFLMHITYILFSLSLSPSIHYHTVDYKKNHCIFIAVGTLIKCCKMKRKQKKKNTQVNAHWRRCFDCIWQHRGQNGEKKFTQLSFLAKRMQSKNQENKVGLFSGRYHHSDIAIEIEQINIMHPFTWRPSLVLKPNSSMWIHYIGLWITEAPENALQYEEMNGSGGLSCNGTLIENDPNYTIRITSPQSLYHSGSRNEW